MHTVTGLAHDRESHVAYDPSNEESIHFRSLTRRAAAHARGAAAVRPGAGRSPGDRLGSTKGAIEEAVESLQREGRKVSSMHLRFLQPLPPGIKERCAASSVMTIEGNWSDRPKTS